MFLVLHSFSKRSKLFAIYCGAVIVWRMEDMECMGIPYMVKERALAPCNVCTRINLDHIDNFLSCFHFIHFLRNPSISMHAFLPAQVSSFTPIFHIPLKLLLFFCIAWVAKTGSGEAHWKYGWFNTKN